MMKSSRIGEHKNIKENIIKVIFLDLKKKTKPLNTEYLKKLEISSSRLL